MRSVKWAALLFLLFLPSAAHVSAGPVEVHVSYGAMEKMLLEGVFTAQGRNYLYGSPDTPCMSGYLFEPKLSGADGRIRIQMKFQGSLGEFVVGKCRGVSEGFPVDLTGKLFYREGILGLEDIRTGGARRDTPFNQYIDDFINVELQRFLRYDAAAMLQSLVIDLREQTAVDLEVHDFDIPEITVDSQGIRYGMGFTLEVR